MVKLVGGQEEADLTYSHYDLVHEYRAWQVLYVECCQIVIELAGDHDAAHEDEIHKESSHEKKLLDRASKLLILFFFQVQLGNNLGYILHGSCIALCYLELL